MQEESTPHEDTTSRVVHASPWRLSEVYPLEHYRLYVKFIDGLEGSVDLSQFIKSDQAGVFKRLRDSQLFQSVYLKHGAVTWPGDLDLAPDAMYDGIKSHREWIVR